MTGEPLEPAECPWSTRPARAGDERWLVELYGQAGLAQPSLEAWRWKLGGQGDLSNVFLAEVQGRPVFQYAGIPTRVRFRSRCTSAMVSVDTITRPDYRRRGLLTQVGSATYAHWRSRGIPFVLGLPNEQWGSRARALGWRPVGELRWWARVLDWKALVAARLGFPPGSRASGEIQDLGRGSGGRGLEPLPAGDAGQVDQLWARVPREGVIRDGGWVTWRYLQSPEAWTVLGARDGAGLAGVLALRTHRREGVSLATIGEVWGVGPGVERRLLAAACQRARAGGAARIAVLVPTSSPLEASALAVGFLPRAHPFAVQAVDLGGGLPRGASFQGGDFDVV